MAEAACESRIGLICAVLLPGVRAGSLVSARLAGTQHLTPRDVAAIRTGGPFLLALPLRRWLALPRLPPLRMAAPVATAEPRFPLLAYAGFTVAPAAHGAVLMPDVLPVPTASLAAVVPWSPALAAWLLLGAPLGFVGLAGVALVALGMVLGVRAASRGVPPEPGLR